MTLSTVVDIDKAKKILPKQLVSLKKLSNKYKSVAKCLFALVTSFLF